MSGTWDWALKETSRFSTNEELGKYWWIWVQNSQGMIKTGNLKKKGKIGDKQHQVCFQRCKVIYCTLLCHDHRWKF